MARYAVYELDPVKGPVAIAQGGPDIGWEHESPKVSKLLEEPSRVFGGKPFDPKDPKHWARLPALFHGHRLWAGRVADADLAKVEEWDETKHPRDKAGEFAAEGNQGDIGPEGDALFQPDDDVAAGRPAPTPDRWDEIKAKINDNMGGDRLLLSESEDGVMWNKAKPKDDPHRDQLVEEWQQQVTRKKEQLKTGAISEDYYYGIMYEVTGKGNHPELVSDKELAAAYKYANDKGDQQAMAAIVKHGVDKNRGQVKPRLPSGKMTAAVARAKMVETVMRNPPEIAEIEKQLEPHRKKYWGMIDQSEALELRIASMEIRANAGVADMEPGEFTEFSAEYGRLVKEHAALQTQMVEVMSTIRTFTKKQDEALSKAREAGRQAAKELLYVEKPMGFRADYSPAVSNMPELYQQTIKNGMGLFSQLVDNDILPDGRAHNLFVGVDSGTRSYHSQGEIFISASSGTVVVAHELGHWLEYQSSAVHNAAVDFLKKRTDGEQEQALKDLLPEYGYDETEITRKDAFPDPYCGKMYLGMRSTEIVSMGLQYMADDPSYFAQKDPDYFDFIYDVCHGRYQ